MLPDLSNSLDAARGLLGWELVHHTPDGDIGGIIIETEAYRQDDEASHSFKGVTKRTAPMFADAGTLYMYFIYGMHWCINIVAGPKGVGEAVLLRALKPTIGIELMKQHRKTDDIRRLANGPGNLVQALALPSSLNGQKLTQTSLELIPPRNTKLKIDASTRIGISKAADRLWRFRLKL
ncbi:DNA-3-methyladenine glycosylase [soil metagenome]